MKNILEIKIEKADKLSKRLDCKVEVENNNENQKLIKERWIWELLHTIQQYLISMPFYLLPVQINSISITH